MIVKFTAPLWLWTGKGAWHFITLPEDQSGLIRMASPRRGFGSVRVHARIGESNWKTSVFPDGKRGCYLLPVKAEIRKAERLILNADVDVSLSLDL